ncbi:MAG TPA: hypothetical protein VGR47_09490 [Terracidiphilus sp.]|nr:hypothetical protein [Terracidiphilus sp.]
MKQPLERFLLKCFSGPALVFVAAFASFTFPLSASAQTGAGNQQQSAQSAPPQQNIPTANPGRPTVSTPATLTPVGYLQFETGLLAAWHSPEFSSQQSLGEVTKFTLFPRLEFLAGTGPYIHSDTQPQNGTGDITLGAQGIIHPGEGPRPTLALSYFRDVFSGGTPDIGSASNSALFLVSADVKGFHYDTNYIFNEQVSDAGVRRAQYGQTLSISHGLGENFGIAGEIWHFTQPLLRSNAVGNLWAVNYNARKNLVFDAGFNRGLTTTSTRWEILTGFTYLLPIKIHLE